MATPPTIYESADPSGHVYAAVVQLAFLHGNPFVVSREELGMLVGIPAWMVRRELSALSAVGAIRYRVLDGAKVIEVVTRREGGPGPG